MNGHTERDLSSRASREAFLAYLHEYLVQSGCMQTAEALTKETNVRPASDLQDTFFYDWWCLLLNLHNFSGTQAQDPGPEAPNGWENGPLALETPDHLAPFKAFMNTQAFKVPANGGTENIALNGAQITTAAAVVAPSKLSPSVARTPAKTKGKSRKSLANGKVTKKGLPILVPGVAPLVVPRKTSASSTQTPNSKNGAVALKKGNSQQPDTPLWDNNPLVGEQFPQENATQRQLKQMLKIGETPGLVSPAPTQPKMKLKLQLNTKKQRKNAQEQSQKKSGDDPQPEMQLLEQQQIQQHQQHPQQLHHHPQQHPQHPQHPQHQQFLQQQQMFQQQQFLQLQQQTQQHAHVHGNGNPGVGAVPTGLITGNNSMAPARGGQPIVDGQMMMSKPEHLSDIMGNANDTKFLDDMMGGNMYMNGGLGFPTDPQMDGLGFDTLRTMVQGDYTGNGEMYAHLQAHAKEPGFDDKVGDHAGMINTGGVSGDNFMNENFVFDANVQMPLGLPDEHGGVSHDVSQGNNFRGGPNYGFVTDGGNNGDFFLEAPLTMSL